MQIKELILDFKGIDYSLLKTDFYSVNLISS